ncbi:hypothetical protein ACFYMB_31405 [Micromonospora haikouensis]|uniref:hypothetical protein n=1 Tax=Micromonospora haikouensis TaxID=686309 RepID=UPI003694F990
MAASDPTGSARTPLPNLSTYEHFRHSTALDARGDVTLFHGPDGQLHLFRDGCEHGLLVGRDGDDRWTLTREVYTRTTSTSGERWELIANPDPACSGGWDPSRREYVARHWPTGRVIARWDTQYGLLARAARRYLRATTAPQAAQGSSRNAAGPSASSRSTSTS